MCPSRRWQCYLESCHLSKREARVTLHPVPCPSNLLKSYMKPQSLLFIILPRNVTHLTNNECIFTNSPVAPPYQFLCSLVSLLSISVPILLWFLHHTSIHQHLHRSTPDTAVVSSDATPLSLGWTDGRLVCNSCLFCFCLSFWTCLRLFLCRYLCHFVFCVESCFDNVSWNKSSLLSFSI